MLQYNRMICCNMNNLIPFACIQISTSAVMEYIAVSRCATTLQDHITVYVLMVMNSITMASHVMVRFYLAIASYNYYSFIMILCDTIRSFNEVLCPCVYTDVDECRTGIDECEHRCHNSNGSYTCSCDSGFILNDGFRCDGKCLLSS